MPDRHTPATRILRTQTANPYRWRARLRHLRTLTLIVMTVVVVVTLVMLILHPPGTATSAYVPVVEP